MISFKVAYAFSPRFPCCNAKKHAKKYSAAHVSGLTILAIRGIQRIASPKGLLRLIVKIFNFIAPLGINKAAFLLNLNQYALKC